MNAETFARAVQQRLHADGAQTVLEEKRWRLFLDMLQACRAYVPSAADCDDWHVNYHEDGLRNTLVWSAQITTQEAARLLTPYPETIRQQRFAVALVHVRRLLWAQLEAILDARAVGEDDPEALARLIVLADYFPHEYHAFDIRIRADLWSNDGVSYAPAAATKEYQAYAAVLHVPERFEQAKTDNGSWQSRSLYDPTPPSSERARVAPLMEEANAVLYEPVRACFAAAGLPTAEDGE